MTQEQRLRAGDKVEYIPDNGETPKVGKILCFIEGGSIVLECKDENGRLEWPVVREEQLRQIML